jgi:hypothetical protein
MAAEQTKKADGAKKKKVRYMQLNETSAGRHSYASIVGYVVGVVYFLMLWSCLTECFVRSPPTNGIRQRIASHERHHML